MTSNQRNWPDVQRGVTRFISQGQSMAAVEELDEFLAKAPPEIEAREALVLRSMAKEDVGDYRGALKDQRQAHTLTGAGSYARYMSELTLSALCAICENGEEAASWLRAALNTAQEGKAFSGSVAVRKFLKMKGERDLNPDERLLCVEVIRRSWYALGQKDEPDVTDLVRAVNLLGELESKPLPPPDE